IERNQLRMSKSKKQIEDMKKELTEEDKLRLQSIDQALRNLSAPQVIKDDTINVEVKPKRHYNKNKYREIERETAQVEPEEVVKNTFLVHPNLEVLKFVIDCIWRVTTSRKRGDDFILNSNNFIKFWSLITQENEDDIELSYDEPIMQSHSCITKKYKKKDIVRIKDVLIKKKEGSPLLIHIINHHDISQPQAIGGPCRQSFTCVKTVHRFKKDVVSISGINGSNSYGF
ncbi:MAG: hypothetical protein EZS28_030386, partial [Streblomastix strix]